MQQRMLPQQDRLLVRCVAFLGQVLAAMRSNVLFWRSYCIQDSSLRWLFFWSMKMVAPQCSAWCS